MSSTTIGDDIGGRPELVEVTASSNCGSSTASVCNAYAPPKRPQVMTELRVNTLLAVAVFTIA